MSDADSVTTPPSPPPAKPPWHDLARGRVARPGEWLVEKGIFAVSLTAIVMILLIFVFVGREALPILLGQADSAAARVQRILPPEDVDRMTPSELRAALGLSRRKFAARSLEEQKAALKEIYAVRAEADRNGAEAIPDKDSEVNTVGWRYLIRPHQWTGYSRPEFIWQPVSQIQKFNVVPLLVGSLKVTLVAVLFALPLALGAALYVSQFASRRLRAWIKPAIEMLAGIPSVVLGFFALFVLAAALESVFAFQSRLNAFVAGIALGVAIIPVIFALAEEALSAVPRGYLEGALAVGASRWQAAWGVALPAAWPGVFAAVVLGFGRALGETMIVLMASGNAAILSWSLFDSSRTVTATIAAELGEVVFGGHHYRVLFLLGTLVLAVSFVANLVADGVMNRLRRRLASSS